MADHKHPVQVTAEGIEGIPSAWIEVGSRGEIRLGVKVYDENVGAAVAKCMQAFDALHAHAVKHIEKIQKNLIDVRLRGH